MKTILIGLFWAAMTVGLQAQDPSIVGSWKYSTIEGIPEDDKQGKMMAEMFFSKMELTFTEDGKWSGTLMKEGEGGYSISEDGKTLMITESGNDQEMPIKIEELTADVFKMNIGTAPGAIVLVRVQVKKTE